jgi:L-asparaginase
MAEATSPHRVRIAAIGLGGTISMVSGSQGLVPTRSLEDLFSALPLAAGVEMECFNMAMGSSASLDLDGIRRVARQIDECLASGCVGVIVLQGTDTMEETSFALELLCQQRGPIVVTGAMRGASQPGSDGPANILGAVAVCLSDRSPAGVCVVMNDEVHAARHVRKTHTTSPAAFSSGEAGLLGRIHEGQYVAYDRSLPALGFSVPKSVDTWPRVALIKLVLGDDGTLLGCVETAGFDGCILEAMGAGHAPEHLVAQIESLSSKMAVVLCSRIEEGRVCRRTYGYPGSETDLISRGVISGGGLHSLKARLLLTFCLATDLSSAAPLFEERICLV